MEEPNGGGDRSSASEGVAEYAGVRDKESEQAPSSAEARDTERVRACQGRHEGLKSVAERIDSFRASGFAAALFEPVFQESSKQFPTDPSRQGSRSDGGRTVDSEVSLFGFARIPTFQEALSGTCGGRRHLDQRRIVVSSLREDMLAVGQVQLLLPDGLQIRISRVGEWSRDERRVVTASTFAHDLTSLDVRGTLPVSELRDGIQAADFKTSLGRYKPGDTVLTVVTKVEAFCDLVTLSTRQSRINPHLQRELVLGRCEAGEACRGWGWGARSEFGGQAGEPEEATMAAGEGAVLDLNAELHKDPLFWNPYAVEHMTRSFSIAERARVLQPAASPHEQQQSAHRRPHSYSELRQRQNESWAEENVKKGVRHAADRNYAMAIKCYQSAIELNANSGDAWVAMGAAFANTSKYQEALKAFTKALEVQPDHRNAARFLEATQNKIRETLGPLADMVLKKDTEGGGGGGGGGGGRGQGGGGAGRGREGVGGRRDGVGEAEGAGAEAMAERGRRWAASVAERSKAAAEAGREDAGEEERRRRKERERKKERKREKKSKDKKSKKERKKGKKKKDRSRDKRKRPRGSRSPSLSDSGSDPPSKRPRVDPAQPEPTASTPAASSGQGPGASQLETAAGPGDARSGPTASESSLSAEAASRLGEAAPRGGAGEDSGSSSSSSES